MTFVLSKYIIYRYFNIRGKKAKLYPENEINFDKFK